MRLRTCMGVLLAGAGTHSFFYYAGKENGSNGRAKINKTITLNKDIVLAYIAIAGGSIASDNLGLGILVSLIFLTYCGSKFSYQLGVNAGCIEYKNNQATIITENRL